MILIRMECFVINADGSIAEDTDSKDIRGIADLMNGMCLGCHTNASTDYIFTK